MHPLLPQTFAQIHMYTKQDAFYFENKVGLQCSRLRTEGNFRNIAFWEFGQAHNVPGCILKVISGTLHFGNEVRPTMF